MTKPKIVPTKLNWEYCECGCHGYELVGAPIHRWCLLVLDGRDKPYFLHEGHGYIGRKMGQYSTMKEADDVVVAELEVIYKDLGKMLGKRTKK